MSEVVNVVVALAVIVFIVRWATNKNEPSNENSTRAVLGFRPKNITPDMIETVQAMFPEIPRDNIRYDLLRTGSVELTTNKILEKGFLDAPPPAYHRLYSPESHTNPQHQQNQPTGPNANARLGAHPGTGSSLQKKDPTLITRFGLDTRLADDVPIAGAEEAGGKADWESTPEQRERSLRERKAQMILAARKRIIAQEKGEI